MGVSTIHVNRNGTPASSVKVVLSFASGGVTSPIFTDQNGKAVITHDGNGSASVFINGSNKGVVRAPTTESFSI